AGMKIMSRKSAQHLKHIQTKTLDNIIIIFKVQDNKSSNNPRRNSRTPYKPRGIGLGLPAYSW
ncbi:hypothetical protein L9F63_001658, partial [Diploptera punctata]